MTNITFSDIQSAMNQIQPYVHRTPIISSSQLNHWLGHDVYFKCENTQKVGAFKARGALNAIIQYKSKIRTPQKVIANSSGNHAQAVAWSCSLLGLQSRIFMPKNVSRVKKLATKFYGAEVVLGTDRSDIDRLVLEASNKKDYLWIPPYDHDQVICGQGTALLESFSQLDENKIDAVFAPCGGGGLLSGTLIASRKLMPNTKVIGVEPLNANDAAQSLKSDSIVSLDKSPETLADGARTLSISDRTFYYLKQCDDFFEVEEKDICYWTQWLTHLLKMTIEPTSAMCFEGAFQWLKSQNRRQKILIIISGGNIDHLSRSKIWASDALNVNPGER